MSTALVAVAASAPKILCAQQSETSISFDDDGNAAITQTNWPDEDQTIHISRDNIETFLDGICDAFGVPPFGGSR